MRDLVKPGGLPIIGRRKNQPEASGSTAQTPEVPRNATVRLDKDLPDLPPSATARLEVRRNPTFEGRSVRSVDSVASERPLPGVAVDPSRSRKGPHEQGIQKALMQSASTPNAKIVMVGYSPTGGGHTKRCLDVIEFALESGELPPGSTVILNVPEKWTREWNGKPQPRPELLAKLGQQLANNGVNYILAGAEKSVIGYLHSDGTSDDPSLIRRFGLQSVRAKAQVTSVLDCKLFSVQDVPSSSDAAAAEATQGKGKGKEGAGPAVVVDSADEIITDPRSIRTATKLNARTAPLDACYDPSDIQNVPTIKASDLVSTLKGVLGNKPFADKVMVFADMDEALIKAAKKHGCTRIVDQQNHPVLLDMSSPATATQRVADTKANNDPKNAILGKVLSGSAVVSYIGLGDKNTLTEVGALAESLGITAETDKGTARDLVVKHILDKGRVSDPPAVEGYLVHSSVKGPEDINNVVVVYAHNFTKRICEHIQKELEDSGEEGGADLKNTLFLFAGAQAVPGANAIHLAYLADACTIATCGAGVVGEALFRHQFCDSNARFMALPIKDHDEQASNANYAANKRAMFVSNVSDTSKLESDVDSFLRRSTADAGKKYAGTMGQMLSAQGVNSAETYVKQAHDLLFARTEPTATAVRIGGIEKKLRDSPLLEANRKYIKIVFQALDVFKQRLGAGGSLDSLQASFEVSLVENGTPIQFDGAKGLLKCLENSERMLSALIGLPVNVKSMICMQDVLLHLQRLAYGPGSPDDLVNVIENLEEAFGKAVTTGFEQWLKPELLEAEAATA